MGDFKIYFRWFIGLGLIFSILFSWQVTPTAASNYGHPEEFSLYMTLHQHIEHEFTIHGIRMESALATRADYAI
ncbi:MAG TPA: hypothetical protein PKH14_14040 [Syntrophorhabdus sp.]|nr:hypothetical protein [Syntrophorhabdus sp.]